mmetsp:Transcript_14834/g.36309  ORF Transcript_14834/g.36309 Transcript_14834/m.36309 type:complete len:353 (+) Transcript_14834:178-1236(+)
MTNQRNLLVALLVSQLVRSGVTFSIVSAPTALGPQRSRLPLSPRSGARVSPSMTLSPPLSPGDESWGADDVLSVAKLLLARLVPDESPQQSSSTPYKGLHSAAELSSKLTLDFYFSNLKRPGDGALRLDEISAYSSNEQLLRFVEENGLAVKANDSPDTSTLYSRILDALQLTGGKMVGGGKAKRVDPLVEYGQLRPMPAGAQKDDEMVLLTREVLEAYGVRRDEHLHFSLTDCLDGMSVPYETDFTIHNGKIHMDLILREAKIVVSALDQECFVQGTHQVNAHLGHKRQSLKGMGFTVVTVPYFDWQKLPSTRMRVAYIAGKLARAGYWGEGGGLFGKSGTVVKQILRKFH